MDDQFIQFKGVTKRFRHNVVLDNVDLDIPEGKITGIIGASGEGKTTILKLIIGFYKPTAGHVLLLRRNILQDFKNLKKIFGFATEDGSFYEKLTVRENLHHFGRLNHMKHADIKERANELIELMELHGAINTFAENLSMGMKKRLEIAISLIHTPTVLILDEPTADLDPILRNEILTLIKKINQQGTTVILTTQLLSEMDTICDKIAILYDAHMVEQGPPMKIKSKYRVSHLDQVFAKIFSRRVKHKLLVNTEVHKKHKHHKAVVAQAKAQENEKMETYEPQEPAEEAHEETVSSNSASDSNTPATEEEHK